MAYAYMKTTLVFGTDIATAGKMQRARICRHLIGQVVERSAKTPNVLKVRRSRMKLDRNLLMYFPQEDEKWAIDTKSSAEIGDIVLIKGLKDILHPELRHEIDSIVFKHGATVDPVTGRPCRGTEYVDAEEREAEKLRRDTVDLTRKVSTFTDPSDEIKDK